MTASATPPQALVDEATESMQATVLSADVNFASYFSAGLLSDRDVQLLRRYDKKDRFTQAALWEKVRATTQRQRDAPRSAVCCARVFGGDTLDAAAPPERNSAPALILWWAVRWSPGAAPHAATRRADAPPCRRELRTPRCS